MQEHSAERWMEIPGQNGWYEVSNFGRVRSLDRVITGRDGRSFFRAGRVLSPCPDRLGKLQVYMANRSRRHVHILVKHTFDGPPPPGMIVCHENGNGQDNRLANLYFGTHQQNGRDMRRHGTDWHLNKTHCPHGHEYAGGNLLMAKRKLPTGPSESRKCRACTLAGALVSRYKAQGRPCPDKRKLADEYYAKFSRVAA